MDGKRVVWLLIAAAVVMAVLAPSFMPLTPFLLLAAAINLAIAAAYWLLLRAKKDPYSLAALREQIERDELDEYEEPEAVADQVLCPCCHTEYSARYPTCPNCAKRKQPPR